MKPLIVTVALLILACGTSITEPRPIAIEYTIELINGTMSDVFYITPDGAMNAVKVLPGDSVYHYEFVFESGDQAGLGAYPGEQSAVTVILTQDGENVITEYILEHEVTVWYWKVGE